MSLTLYARHAQRWKDCTKCELHTNRTRVVLARGKVPCDLLFCGEAPGISEDVLGKSFIGPAGKLLDEIVERALGEEYKDFRIAFTNIVACIPKGEEGTKVSIPPTECIKACRPRLHEFMELAQPRYVITVGAVAQKNMVLPESLKEARTTSIIHPAAILRGDLSQRELTIQRCIIAIRDLIEYDEVPF